MILAALTLTLPISAILPSLTAISASRRGAPVPSITVPFFYQQVTSHRRLSVFRCVVTIAIRNRTGERKERRNRQNWRRTR